MLLKNGLSYTLSLKTGLQMKFALNIVLLHAYFSVQGKEYYDITLKGPLCFPQIACIPFSPPEVTTGLNFIFGISLLFLKLYNIQLQACPEHLPW